MGANSRRLRERRKDLDIQANARTTETTVATTAGDVQIVHNVGGNRLQMFFPGKAPQDVRTALKCAGLR